MALPIRYKDQIQFIFEPGQEHNIEATINEFLATDRPANLIEAKMSIDERFTIITFFVSVVKLAPEDEQLFFNKTFVCETASEERLSKEVTAFLKEDIFPYERTADTGAQWHDERFLIYTLFYRKERILE